LQRQITYWNRQLDGVPAILDLPTDKPRPPFLSYSGATESFSLPAKLSESLKSLCRQERVTLFMGLLGAFQVLLHRYSGQADFIFSSGVANRNHSFLEPLIGCFINILLLRADLSRSTTFREHLKKVREVVLGAHSHQDIPFEKLIEIINPERDLSHQPM